MSIQEIRALIDRWAEAASNQDIGTMGSLLDADFRYDNPNQPKVRTRDEYVQYMSAVFSGYPDIHVTPEDVLITGDRFAVRWSVIGTHAGTSPALGVAATNKPVSFTSVAIGRVSGGLLAECYEVIDTLTLMRQLGTYPAQIERGA